MKAKFTTALVCALMISGTFLTNSCKKSTSPPTTCVSAMSDTVVAGQPVTFSSCTQGASTYSWSFGDGSVASTATATHTYATPGIYNVLFTPSNSGGSGTPKSFTVTVVGAGGNWTFQSTNFNANSSNDTAAGGFGFAEILDTIGTTVNAVEVLFANGLPTTNGSYLVTTYPPSGSNTAAILVGNFGISGGALNTYSSTGGNGSNQHLSVTVSGGKVKISGSNIEVLNQNSATDSTAFTFAIR